jgi:hypothetical protein
VALTATVAPTAAAGTVQFRDGNANIGPPVAVNNGIATRTATFEVGSHQLTAVFTPTDDELFAPSTSLPETFEVVPDPLLEAAAAVVPEPDPDTQDGSERPGVVRDRVVPSSAASSSHPTNVMTLALIQGARLLTTMRFSQQDQAPSQPSHRAQA